MKLVAKVSGVQRLMISREARPIAARPSSLGNPAGCRLSLTFSRRPERLNSNPASIVDAIQKNPWIVVSQILIYRLP
jgi:hypothetical protein